MTNEQKQLFSFQFITHCSAKYDYYRSAEMALQGGCKWIQLRMKEAAVAEVEAVALRLQALCKAHRAVFIVNDHVELCKKIGADGVHLGKEDMSPCQARAIVGAKCIIGATCNTKEDIVEKTSLPIDYVGLGPFDFTATKKNHSPVLAMQGYRDRMQQCRKDGITIPVVAIGGITLDHIAPLLRTGINGIAVSGAILRAENPVEETEKIRKEINRIYTIK
jgi:thiamine-phosphate pyrophosphorylase